MKRKDEIQNKIVTVLKRFLNSTLICFEAFLTQVHLDFIVVCVIYILLLHVTVLSYVCFFFFLILTISGAFLSSLLLFYH